MQSEIFFDEQISFFEYKGIIREKMIDYKFNERSYLYRTFAELIQCKELTEFIKNYNIIFPVPLSRKRMKERGYNQSLLVAKQLLKQTKLTNVILKDKVLYKIKNINPQSSMQTRQARINNIKDVYKINNKINVNNKSVIIFDDIFTTGSTANECAKVLKQAGANKVGVMTIAKD